MRVGYVGLGAMGRPMAANLAARFDTVVFNRTAAVAQEHAEVHGTTAVGSLEELGDVDVLCTCLPTDAEVLAVATALAPTLGAGTVWIDHTSGDPAGSRDVAAMLAEVGVHYLDAPVSGGTSGAEAGTLTIMVGGDPEDLARVADVLDAVAARVVHVGPAGAGMAVKAVNQALLASSLWAASEGLVALEAAGVDAGAALEVINGATGRSFVTERLLPERALTRAFPRTFALGLLAKDVALARSVVAAGGADGQLTRLVDRLTASAAEELGPEADHVEVVRVIERAVGTELGSVATAAAGRGGGPTATGPGR